MKKLKQNILSIHKEKGKSWLDALPKFLKDIEQKCLIKLGKPFENLSYNYVAQAITQEGKAVVLKCGVPSKELITEITALKYYNGQGAVQLLDANAEEGWLLLELCKPGNTLQKIENDAEIIKISINVLQNLWKPIKNSTILSTQGSESSQTQVSSQTAQASSRTRSGIQIPNLKNWFKKLTPNKHIPNPLMDFAKTTSKELLTSQSELVLLHGDLHQENILSAQREPWLAIDPKGVIGEREFDLVGTLLQTLDPNKLSKKIVQRRVDQINELTGFDKQRVILWSAVKCVLAACWCIEDNVDGAEKFVAMAEILHHHTEK